MTLAQYLDTHTIGLIETIVLDDGLQAEAKVDSGNDGYNVIDGQNMQINGKNVSFTFEGKQIVKPIVDTISVHIGDSKIDKRPVVTFNMKLGNKTFENVKFSVANREMNDYKILICKDFVKNSKLLIDVSRSNVK